MRPEWVVTSGPSRSLPSRGFPGSTPGRGAMIDQKNMSYKEIEGLPHWCLVVYSDGRALPVAPCCSANEIGGYAASFATEEEAIARAREVVGMFGE